jgi:putative oxidoreductase
VPPSSHTGLKKLFGVWGGAGLAATAASFDSIGLSPGYPLAVAVGLTETLGGVLLMAGALTKFCAAALIVTMLGAIWNVHSPNGFFMNWAMTPGKGHGIEFNVVLIGALVCLMFTGRAPCLSNTAASAGPSPTGPAGRDCAESSSECLSSHQPWTGRES